MLFDISDQNFQTSALRKVTDDMKTHKNPSLRAAEQNPTVKPIPSPKPKLCNQSAAVKPPRCELEGKKWIVVRNRMRIVG